MVQLLIWREMLKTVPPWLDGQVLRPMTCGIINVGSFWREVLSSPSSIMGYMKLTVKFSPYGMKLKGFAFLFSKKATKYANKLTLHKASYAVFKILNNFTFFFQPFVSSKTIHGHVVCGIGSPHVTRSRWPNLHLNCSLSLAAAAELFWTQSPVSQWDLTWWPATHCLLPAGIPSTNNGFTLMKVLDGRPPERKESVLRLITEDISLGGGHS